MFERFTVAARDIVIQAQTEARDLRSPIIGPQHLLLGTLWHIDEPIRHVLDESGLRYRAVRDRLAEVDVEDGGVTDDDALGRIGIDLSLVRSKVEETFGAGALDGTFEPRGRRRGHIPFDRPAKKALELALREAIHLQHKEIGPEHLLLGLTRLDGAATTLVRSFGVEPAELHDRVSAMLRRAA
ncbi:Clp protease N-terminal domain-containing protein [Microlunatus soli]|uniref:Clp amino terminal domain-containing protein, pathogenicity island component n=1 Tax=Microlunatus soli TaxID=630515 RepID=A0A1H2AAZ7_9ACTN|nr:Clp protease N-terminal domain-containing protein [Microlunatus soli]SDT43151.1 Clp amino terminal domain-containing protein, pathogenicity island component [Microlunatus soli]